VPAIGGHTRASARSRGIWKLKKGRARLVVRERQEVHSMSHIVQIRTQIRDPAALAAACVRLGLAEPKQGTAQLYSGEASGWLVQLPGWRFPVVVDTTVGEARFDNFGGHWGNPKELDRLMQAYAAEKAKLEARRAGHSVTEQSLSDGSIKLTIAAAGGAA
jgi:hypothetical protein